MSSFRQFDAFATVRGEGLHPRLRELLERTATSPAVEIAIRLDGMLQAGPDPSSDARPRDNATPVSPGELGKAAR